nr:unnamed protein product [Digitaria exilis]
MPNLLTKVSIAVAACARRLLRARRLRRGKQQVVPAGGGVQQEQGGALWRRAILMGRRCEPLDFPGAIHYDSSGRRVESPRCGSRKVSGALFCRSSDAVEDAITAAKRANQAH